VGVYGKMYKVTVAEAAARLGVKEQTIRKRIQRSTLAYDKDDDGARIRMSRPRRRVYGYG